MSYRNRTTGPCPSRRRITRAETRRRREARQGAAILALAILAFITFFYVAVQIDAAHGMTIGQSLRSAGL